MNTRSTRNIVATLAVSFTMMAAAPVIAGNDHLGEQALERSRATVLRAKCVDPQGKCIESRMAGDLGIYKCKLKGKHVPPNAPRVNSSWLWEMFC